MENRPDTAESLREELTAQIRSTDPYFLTVGFYSNVVDYIKVSGLSAWELVSEIAEVHLNYYDAILDEQFKSSDRECILRILAILKTFNRQIPGIQEAINMQAEAELLYANYLRAAKVSEERIKESFEKSLNTAFSGTINTAKKPDYSLVEDVVVSYGDWLISIGQKQYAKQLCEEVYLINPDTTIFADLGFTDPHEASLRRMATKKALDPLARQHKAEGMQLEILLHMYEGRVLKAAELLEELAAFDPGTAIQTSRSISGGTRNFYTLRQRI